MPGCDYNATDQCGGSNSYFAPAAERAKVVCPHGNGMIAKMPVYILPIQEETRLER